MIALLKESLQLFDEIVDSWTGLDEEDHLPGFPELWHQLLYGMCTLLDRLPSMIALLKESLQLFDEIVDSWTGLDEEDHLPGFPELQRQLLYGMCALLNRLPSSSVSTWHKRRTVASTFFTTRITRSLQTRNRWIRSLWYGKLSQGNESAGVNDCPSQGKCPVV